MNLIDIFTNTFLPAINWKVFWIGNLYLVICVIIHELGHLIPLWFYGKRPKLKPRWFGVEVIDENNYYDLSVHQVGIIAFTGILTGLLVTFVFINILNLIPSWWYLVYIVTCAIDLLTLYQVNKYHYKFWWINWGIIMNHINRKNYTESKKSLLECWNKKRSL